jgi:hypothetical protein
VRRLGQGRSGFAQRAVQLIERLGFADLAERLERLAVAVSVRPHRCYLDDLLMQASRGRTIEGEAGHHHDARLGAGPLDDADARQARLEPLTQEA